jgi:quercetin dioxygenase-like cupin family protein
LENYSGEQAAETHLEDEEDNTMATKIKLTLIMASRVKWLVLGMLIAVIATTPVAAHPIEPEHGVTRESLARGAANIENLIQIEEGVTDIRVGRTTLEAGGDVPWHYHTGPALVVVESGTVTIENADQVGDPTDYPAGSAFIEAKGHVHKASNNGNEDAVLLVTIAVAGGPPDETPSTIFLP